jgi:hypothetical protein
MHKTDRFLQLFLGKVETSEVADDDADGQTLFFNPTA